MDIDETKLRRLDFSTLLIFLKLIQKRKAVAVADAMGLTQSSISHALKRLRSTFDDELFIRRPDGLEPTAFAMGIEARVRQAVDAVGSALSEPEQFEPSTSRAAVRVGANDYELTTILPGLISAATEQAPYMQFVTRAFLRRPALEALRLGELDLALGMFNRPGRDFVMQDLIEENYLVVGRSDNPALKTASQLDAYCAARHLLVSLRGDRHGIVDATLETKGRSRIVAVTTPLFMTALATIAETDLLATLPARLALKYARSFGLRVEEPPISIRSFTVRAVLHRRNVGSPLISWLVARLQEQFVDRGTT